MIVKTAEEIYKHLTDNIPGGKLIPGKMLIFLDEIQKCAGARTALKFLAKDGRYSDTFHKLIALFFIFDKLAMITLLNYLKTTKTL